MFTTSTFYPLLLQPSAAETGCVQLATDHAAKEHLQTHIWYESDFTTVVHESGLIPLRDTGKESLRGVDCREVDCLEY